MHIPIQSKSIVRVSDSCVSVVPMIEREHLVFWSVDMKEFIGFPVVPVSRPFLTSWIHESVASLAFDSSASRV